MYVYTKDPAYVWTTVIQVRIQGPPPPGRQELRDPFPPMAPKPNVLREGATRSHAGRSEDEATN